MPTPHSSLTGDNLHYNQGDSRSLSAWTLAAGTSDALLVENSNNNELIAISTSVTPGSTTIDIGNTTDRPAVDIACTTTRIRIPVSTASGFSVATNSGLDVPFRINSAAADGPHTVWISESWLRMDEVAGAPTNSAGTGYLYTRDDSGTTRLTFMRDNGTTVDLDNAGGGTPGGSDTQIQYNNAGAFGGMANVEHLDGNLSLQDDTGPTAPSSGVVLVSAPEASSQLAVLGADSPNLLVGPPWASADVVMWRANGTTTLLEIGIPGGVAGTPTVPALSSGSYVGRSVQYRITSSGGTNQGSGRGGTIASFSMDGGFWCKWRYGISSSQSNSAFFVGLTAATGAITSGAPDSFVNMIGFSKLASDSGWWSTSNDATGTATSHTSLGADFALPSSSAVFDLVLYCPPGGTAVEWWAARADNRSLSPVSGTISSNLPAGTTFMAPRFYGNTGGSATAVVHELSFFVAYRAEG